MRAVKETPQEHANRALSVWQLQRAMGIEAQDRRIPAPMNDADSFERDLAIIRECMDRGK